MNGINTRIGLLAFVILGWPPFVFGQKGKQVAPLLEGMGAHHFSITTTVPRAQRFFDQGLVLAYGFNHAEAEQVYREDLQDHPKNGWALFGLAQSLRAQGKTDEARAVEQRFKKAWTAADITFSRSWF